MGHMEGWVDFDGPGQLATNCDRINDIVNRERSYKTGCQLLGLHLQKKISSGEPYFLAHMIGRLLRSASIGPSDVDHQSFQEIFYGFFSMCADTSELLCGLMGLRLLSPG